MIPGAGDAAVPQKLRDILTRGHAHLRGGRNADAMAYSVVALDQYPEHPAALHAGGCSAAALGDFNGARVLWGKALAKQGKCPSALTAANLGDVSRAVGDWAFAEEMLNRATTINPAFIEPYQSLILVADMLRDDPCEHLRLRRAFSDRLDHTHVPLEIDRTPGRPLRIGYIGPSFSEHSAAYTYLRIVTQHDPAAFETHLYHTGIADAWTPNFQQPHVHWHDLTLESDDVVLQQIVSDRIDVLVDLAGHTPGGRLEVLARKPAPVQIAAWGYATTTGLPEIDAIFTDSVHCPPSFDGQYVSERPYYLPSVIPYSVADAYPPIRPRQPDQPLTFGYGGNPNKLTPECLRTWTRVLQALPDARLWLGGMGFELPHIQQALAAGLAGIDQQRVTIAPRAAHVAHLQRLDQIDVMLDAWPHNGGVTTVDSLLMGVPMVTRVGQSLPARTAGALLHAVRLDAWMTESADEFVHCAVTLGRNARRMPRGQALRERVLRSPICQLDAYRTAAEDAYRELWEEAIA